jgi:ABC-type amino acid transport substrate-binding protein
VLAHRLAGSNPRLALSAATFLRQKSDFLKEGNEAEELAKSQIAAARGVELAKIKNELYARIADLLTKERTESFARRIGQSIDRLEEERRDTLNALKRGELNRLTAFYMLRQYQKDQEQVPPADRYRFLRRYQPGLLADLRTRLAPEVRAAVDQELNRIMASYQAALED